MEQALVFVKEGINGEYIGWKNRHAEFDEGANSIYKRSKKKKGSALVVFSSIFLMSVFFVAILFTVNNAMKIKKAELSPSPSLPVLLGNLLGIGTADNLKEIKDVSELILLSVYGEPKADKADATEIPMESEKPEEFLPVIKDEQVPDIMEVYKNIFLKQEDIPKGTYRIVPTDLATEYDGNIRLYNNTSYDPNIAELLELNTVSSAVPSNSPLVLVIHTHGTEAYSDPEKGYYSETENIPRTEDTTKNVVAVGKVFCDVLEKNGIGTVHSTVMHDKSGYIDSYERSRRTVEEYLKRYPTIKYVFDIHRDSVLYDDGRKARPICVANGKVAAQIMTVVGSDVVLGDHPDWQNNLSVALKLQKQLIDNSPGFARAICLKASSYNQFLSQGSLLIEIGSCGNTLEEAENAAEYLAEQIADLIRSNSN